MPTVVSPAKELIEVVPDDDFAELVGIPPRALKQLNARLPIVASLWNHGAFRDKSGFATNQLRQYAADHYGYSAGQIAHLMTSPFFTGALERRVNGRKTYEIRLTALPQMYVDKVQKLNGATASPEPIDDDPPEPTPAPTPGDGDDGDGERSTVDVETPPPTELPVDALPYFTLSEHPDVYAAVGAALLSQVASVIRNGSFTPQAEQQLRALAASKAQTEGLLGQRLEENHRLRQQVREQSDTINALRHERDGLRSRIGALESNLAAALKGDAAAFVVETVNRELSNVMREKPRNVA